MYSESIKFKNPPRPQPNTNLQSKIQIIDDKGGDSASGGHKQQSTKHREENVMAKAMAVVKL
jgi:hypothetical protein